jgi:hypothetical protein
VRVPCIDEDNPSVHKTPVDVDNLPTSITEDPDWIKLGKCRTEVLRLSQIQFHVFSLIWTEDKIIFRG